MHLMVPKDTLRGTGVGFQAPSPAPPSQDLVPVEEWSGRAADVSSLASAGAVGSVYRHPGLPRLPALHPPGSPCSSKPLCSFFLFCLALAFALHTLPLMEAAPNLSVTLPLFLPSLCAPQGEVKEIKE